MAADYRTDAFRENLHSLVKSMDYPIKLRKNPTLYLAEAPGPVKPEAAKITNYYADIVP